MKVHEIRVRATIYGTELDKYVGLECDAVIKAILTSNWKKIRFRRFERVDEDKIVITMEKY